MKKFAAFRNPIILKRTRATKSARITGDRTLPQNKLPLVSQGINDHLVRLLDVCGAIDMKGFEQSKVRVIDTEVIVPYRLPSHPQVALTHTSADIDRGT
jgi:hypothetical protein